MPEITGLKIELTVLSIPHFVILYSLMFLVNVKQSSIALQPTPSVLSTCSLSVSRWLVDLSCLSSGSEPNTSGELLLNLVRLKPWAVITSILSCHNYLACSSGGIDYRKSAIKNDFNTLSIFDWL